MFRPDKTDSTQLVRSSFFLFLHSWLDWQFAFFKLAPQKKKEENKNQIHPVPFFCCVYTVVVCLVDFAKMRIVFYFIFLFDSLFELLCCAWFLSNFVWEKQSSVKYTPIVAVVVTGGSIAWKCSDQRFISFHFVSLYKIIWMNYCSSFLFM